MKKKTFVFVVQFLLCLFSWAYAGNSVVLYVGQQRTISVRGAEQIAIAGKGQIATGSLLSNGKSIVLTGHKPGVVSMTVSYKNGRKEERTIRVLSREREQVLIEFDKISPLFNDIHIISVGSNIGLVGKVYSITEANYLEAFLNRYPEIINLMEDKRGDVLLQMDVRILEVNLNDAANLGVDWFTSATNNVSFPQGLDYGEVSSQKGSVAFGEEYVPRRVFPDPQVAVGPLARLSPFTAKLNFLVEKGSAKVLARPKLICKSGEKAEFRVGGEFPVRIATPEKAQIEWKSYGTHLEIEPVLVKMGSNEVDVNIHIEISDIDWANQVEGYPAVSQRIASTKIKVLENNAVAIAGLISHKKSRVQSRIPFLGAIPFLGRLFSSTRDTDQVMETVILITPRIISIDSGKLNIMPESNEIREELKKPGSKKKKK